MGLLDHMVVLFLFLFLRIFHVSMVAAQFTFPEQCIWLSVCIVVTVGLLHAHGGGGCWWQVCWPFLSSLRRAAAFVCREGHPKLQWILLCGCYGSPWFSSLFLAISVPLNFAWLWVTEMVPSCYTQNWSLTLLFLSLQQEFFLAGEFPLGAEHCCLGRWDHRSKM